MFTVASHIAATFTTMPVGVAMNGAFMVAPVNQQSIQPILGRLCI